jgi:hypothetical protein
MMEDEGVTREIFLVPYSLLREQPLRSYGRCILGWQPGVQVAGKGIR